MKNQKRLVFVLVLWVAGFLFAQEVWRTPAEWLEVIRANPEGPSATDPELADLELGALMIADNWKLEGMTPEQLVTFSNINAFVAEPGKAIREKWLSGAALDLEEEKYIWIVKTLYMAEGKKGLRKLSERAVSKPKTPSEHYTFTASRLGWEILAKGYRGEQLTEADITALREFHLWTSTKHGRLPFLPYCVGMSRTTRYRAGDEFPDFKFKTFESVVSAPGYSDTGAPEPDYTACLKPKGIERYLLMFQGYEIQKHVAGDEWCYSKAALPGFLESDAGTVQLSSFRGKKPVVLISSDLKDVYCRRWFPTLETLYQAYKDEVEFFIVNVAFDDWWFLTTQYGARIDSYYSTYLESARSAKDAYLWKPNVSVPCLLDDSASSFRNALATAAGGGNFVILDMDGRVAYENPGERWPGFGETGRDCHDESFWLNELETELQILLGNRGRYSRNRPKDYQNEVSEMRLKLYEQTGRHWLKYKNWPSGRYTSPIWFCGKISSVDSENRTVTAVVLVDPDAMPGYRFHQEELRKKEAGEPTTFEPNQWAAKNSEVLDRWVNGSEADRTYVFEIEEDVELFLNGKAADFADLQVGDQVGVRYGYLPDTLKDPENPDSKNFKAADIRKTPEGFTRVMPEQVRISRLPKPKKKWWLW